MPSTRLSFTAGDVSVRATCSANGRRLSSSVADGTSLWNGSRMGPLQVEIDEQSRENSSRFVRQKKRREQSIRTSAQGAASLAGCFQVRYAAASTCSHHGTMQ